MSPFLRSHPRALLAATAIAVAVPAGALASGSAGASSSGNLEGAIAAAQAHAGELSAGIGADSRQIAGYQGSIDDLQTQLGALESSLAFERNQLAKLKSELAAARTQLAALQAQLTHDKQVLVAQVVASYEEPPPSIATVVLESHGFADLIERVDDLRAIASENAQATVRVAAEGQAVTLQAARLAELEARAQRNASAVKVQRDEVAQLHRRAKREERGAERAALPRAVPRTRTGRDPDARTGCAGRLHRPRGHPHGGPRRRIRLLPGPRHELQRGR
jgi:septal ring factor EnvC (AmiA/AmiB activator)